jgi:phosphoadenosine phosphosulfate reductase
MTASTTSGQPPLAVVTPDPPTTISPTPASPELLAELAEYSRRLESADPQAIIRWAVEKYFPKLTMATAFGP